MCLYVLMHLEEEPSLTERDPDEVRIKLTNNIHPIHVPRASPWYSMKLNAVVQRMIKLDPHQRPSLGRLA